ncbi:alpha/beta-hydrolase [Dothidotthia symphoricarpi CBS 119687]|uniref:Alpha/beta-hydrolase n=1 Tax=Dothidotthia symphoricarpi CBS 119687 TaxID=1392245 RepID=A0A6A6AWT9_9PLEO|nr:alpha/beta-hydrolase [Dothidotthia symphoricarpi CBS 119687]KAF2135001.1 alpha/beta-hydrolase [Dothidotthia symphoricarpi CBS 119687]
MAPLDDTTPETRFSSFTTHRTTYKNLNTHAIAVGILIPKNLPPRKKHPIIVKFHGGGLILEDLADFWTWLHDGGVDEFFAAQNICIELDYEHVLAAGDSAGGYLALMSGLTQPKGRVKAILAQYPMTYSLRREATPMLLDKPSPPPAVVDEHIAAIVPGAVISSAVPPARMHLSYALSAYGRYLEFFGGDRALWPLYLVEEGGYLPPTWIVHGGADQVVSVGDSRAFVEKCRVWLEGGEVRFEVREGMGHGFDGGVREEGEEWLREGLGWVERMWCG